MSELIFSDKRDENKLLLRYSAFNFTHNLASNCLQKIKNYDVYKLLIRSFPEKYIDLYYQKLFFESFSALGSQSVINYWHKKNEGDFLKKKIILNTFLPKKLLDSIWHIREFNYQKTYKKELFKELEYKIYPFYFKFKKYKNKLNIKNKNSKSSKSIIAVNYIEGHNLEKRNDIFWLNNSNIDPSSVLLYFENKKRMLRYSGYDELTSELKKLSIRYVKLWEWSNIKEIDFLNDFLNKVQLIKPNDAIENWLLKDAKIFILKMQYWYSFFHDHNVKIHINSDERGSSNIIRQIALTKLNGCSVGKLRSYPRSINGDWFAYYPNNTYFVWGEDTRDRMKKSGNYFDHLIISGYPYPDKANLKQKKLESIKNNFIKKGAKFIIMLLDGAHMTNNDYRDQGVKTSAIINFYKNFFDWFNVDKEIGIIIKSKSYNELKKLPELMKILNPAEKTGRCYIAESFNEEPKHYTSIIDFSVGVACDMPTAVMQSILNGSKGIIFDYPNLKSIEKDMYSWGDKKVIFNDIEEIIKELKKYKKEPSLNKDLGNWSSKVDKIDSFRDGRGSQRIGKYINLLQNGFNNGLKSNDCLKYATDEYAKEWGRNKIS